MKAQHVQFEANTKQNAPKNIYIKKSPQTNQI